MRVPFLLVASLLSTFAADTVPDAPATTAPRGLTLADAIQLSASIAPVGIANLDTAIARAGYGAERMALLPNLSATGGLTRSTAFIPYTDPSQKAGPANIWDARLRVGQALLDLEAWHKTQAANHQLAAADASVALALEDAATDAGIAYISLASSEALVNVRRQDLALAQDLLKEAQARVDAGATEAIAATRAAVRSESARASLVAAEGSSRRAAIVLARALNLDPAAPLTASNPLTPDLAASAAPTEAVAAEKAAQLARPELRLSSETLAVLDSQRRAVQGSRLPKLSAFADGGRSGGQFDDTIPAWEAGLQLTIPLVDRHMYDEKGAELRVQQQRLRTTDLDARIRAEVRDALVTLTTASAALEAENIARSLAERQIKEAQARFNAGAAGNIEVVDAQVSFSESQERVVLALDTAARARMRLARAVGAATTVK